VIKGCIVTIDAMGCQRDMTTKIIENEADCLLALKGNQGNLPDQVEDSFRFLPAVSVDEQLDAGHGRVETRRCSVISDLSMVEAKGEWAALRSLVKYRMERHIRSTDRTEKETGL
jgi:hypothetical protein